MSTTRLDPRRAAPAPVRDGDRQSEDAVRSLGHSASADVIGLGLLGLQATAGNAAVAHLVASPSRHPGITAPRPTVQRDDGGSNDGGGGDPVMLSGGGGSAGSTTVGPPANSTYTVSGSLIDAANAIASRPEAGAETSAPSLDTVTNGDRIVSATVTVAQTVELPTWSDRGSGTPTQQAEWDRFAAAIATHEQGHVAKDVAVWTGAHAKIAGRSVADGNAKFDAISAAADKANADYDTTTKHGLRQGTGIDPNV
jgi:hypothetical protein